VEADPGARISAAVTGTLVGYTTVTEVSKETVAVK